LGLVKELCEDGEREGKIQPERTQGGTIQYGHMAVIKIENE